MKTITTILLVLSILVFGVGMFTSESAPQQGAAAGMACFIAIIARMAQANAHHYSKMSEDYRREQEGKKSNQ